MAVIEYATGTAIVQETVREVLDAWHDDIAILTNVRNGEEIVVNMRNFLWIKESEKDSKEESLLYQFFDAMGGSQ